MIDRQALNTRPIIAESCSDVIGLSSKILLHDENDDDDD